jgi:hypothetical protein
MIRNYDKILIDVVIHNHDIHLNLKLTDWSVHNENLKITKTRV